MQTDITKKKPKLIPMSNGPRCSDREPEKKPLPPLKKADR